MFAWGEILVVPSPAKVQCTLNPPIRRKVIIKVIDLSHPTGRTSVAAWELPSLSAAASIKPSTSSSSHSYSLPASSSESAISSCPLLRPFSGDEVVSARAAVSVIGWQSFTSFRPSCYCSVIKLNLIQELVLSLFYSLD